VTLDDLRDSVATAIATAIPAFKTKRGFDGPASITEVLRDTHRLPAVLVNTPEDRVVGKMGKLPVVEVHFEAYIVVHTVPGAKNDRGRLSLRLAEAVRNFVVNADFGADHGAENIRRRSLYSTTSDEQGITIQVVDWTQKFQATEVAGELVDLIHIHTEIDLTAGGPAPDSVDDIHFP
jgi:hypothetical protein